MKRWVAKLSSTRFPGGMTTGGITEPVGTVTIHAHLHDAGTHTGRDVDFVISPEHLPAVFRLVREAMAITGQNVVRG